jgi:diguanylate cyclase (GGDEF)-like protein
MSLDKEVSRVKRYGGCLSVIMGDMDHFKRHNDNYGHPSGDEVLRVVAGIMMENCRSSDVVARYGGEEFAAVLIDTDEKEARVVAERIRRHVEGYKFKGNDETSVVNKTISLGIAVFPGDGQASDKEEIVKRADDAMYSAKKGGRNRVCVWGGDDDGDGSKEAVEDMKEEAG